MKQVMLRTLCLVALLIGAAIANESVDGVYGSATDEAGSLLIHVSTMTPGLEDFVRNPDPYPAVYVVTDEMRVYYVQDGYFSDVAYTYFFDSLLLVGELTVVMDGSPRIESLLGYRKRQLSDPGLVNVPSSGRLVCTGTALSMRCSRRAQVVYQHECSFDPVGQTMVCRFR